MNFGLGEDVRLAEILAHVFVRRKNPYVLLQDQNVAETNLIRSKLGHVRTWNPDNGQYQGNQVFRDTFRKVIRAAQIELHVKRK